jgi:16S rRNA pseudouridine516 synthase
LIRLDKLLAHSGYGSRKEVKELIRKGQVSVNEVVIKDDDFKVDEVNDEVIVEGIIVDYQKFIYIMMNKPDGVLSATYDPKDPIVLDLIEDTPTRGLFPVGRLDKDSEGLLLITNDGKLAHELLSPKKHVDKVYYIEYEGELVSDVKERFKEGIILEDDYKCLPASIELLNDNKAYVTISEGKFHQVKRMINMCNGEVTYLKRIKFGPLELDNSLKEGEYRFLSNLELDSLKNR